MMCQPTMQSQPLIEQYCQYYLSITAHDCDTNKDAIILDILVHNFPVGDEQQQHSNCISQATAPAIIEIKGIHVGKHQQVWYPAGMDRGTDQRAWQIQTKYATKAQACNSLFAQDAPDDQHPFEEALRTFLMGGPH
eukprot:3399829-Ditylum_brightwellii.AAC.2